MSKLFINDTSLTAIGDAIREKTGKEDLIPLGDMPSEIRAIETGSSDDYYNAFWDAYQCNGERKDYKNAFSSVQAGKAENYKLYAYWNEKTFKPKYDIKPITNALELFANFWTTDGSLLDFEQYLKDYGVILDFSECTGSVQRIFGNVGFSIIPELVFNENLGSFDRCFYGSSDIETIRKITVSENTVFSAPFNNCYALKNITFGGTIGKDISFASSSLLTVESVQSIIDHLANLTDGTAQVLTLHADVKAKLTEEQIATITNKNWTLA